MIIIENLILRTQTKNKKEAYDLGQDVIKKIVNGLPPVIKNRTFGKSNLEVTVPSRISKREITKFIAEEILKGLI
jgi:hypothetical protein